MSIRKKARVDVVEEYGRRGAFARAVPRAIPRKGEKKRRARPGERNVEKTPFFFRIPSPTFWRKWGIALALGRKEGLLEPGDEDSVKLEPLRCVDRHAREPLAAFLEGILLT